MRRRSFVLGLLALGCVPSVVLASQADATWWVPTSVPDRLDAVATVLLTLLVLLAGTLTVGRVRARSTVVTVTLVEAGAVTGLALVPSALLAVLAGTVVAVVRLSEGATARDAAERTVTAVLSLAGAAAAVLPLARSLQAPFGTGRAATAQSLTAGIPVAGALLAVTLTAFAASLVGWCCTAALGTRATQAPGARRRAVRHLLVATRPAAINVALGVAILALVRDGARGILCVGLLSGLVVALHRRDSESAQARATWQTLSGPGQDTRLLTPAQVQALQVATCRTLFGADWCSLALPDGGVVLDPPGTTVASVASSRAGAVVHDTVGVRIIPRAGAHRSWRHPWSAPATTEATVLLLGSQGGLGTLRLGFERRVRLAVADTAMLAAWARNAANVLQNAVWNAEVVARAARATHDARHDPLTGLLNRAGLLEAARPLQATGRVGVVLIGLDHFKEVNEALGHAAGDAVLRRVAGALRESCRPGDLVARLGGDEFVVLAADLPDDELLEKVATTVMGIVTRPIPVDGMAVCVEGTAGGALMDDDTPDLERLLLAADRALRLAKSSPGSFRRASGLLTPDAERLTLPAELRAGLERGELVPFFQPQVELADGRITGCEVLARWQHPTRGLLPAAEFVPLAEQSGLAARFLDVMLDLAVAEAAAWQRSGYRGDSGQPAPNVAVNLSARNLLDRDLPVRVATALARHGLAAPFLVLEITETVMMSELEVVEDVLSRLRGLGVQLSVDDFGTGYSSLTFLQKVQVNELKVDQSFVSTMCRSPRDTTVVRATVELAHALGLTVVAEGVEDAETLDALRLLGCDVVQGYHLARPMTSAEMWASLWRTGGVHPAVVPAGTDPHLDLSDVPELESARQRREARRAAGA